MKTTLNIENVNRAMDKEFFIGDKEFFSYFVSHVDGQEFKERYNKPCSREINGEMKTYNRTVIPKREKTAMLAKIKLYVEFEKEGKGYLITSVKLAS